jgi:apolipoprotein N-acyltransferase
MLVGAVMRGPGEGERQTSALWWIPGVGVVDRVDKRNAVPFGEYTPLRELMFTLFPETQQVGAQTVPGTKPGVIRAESVAGQPLNIGVIICYELAFDATVRDVVTHGAEIVTVQSNNAGYTGSWQPYQQWQITRVRAMELRREIVVSTTSSLSGLIDANGNVVDITAEATAAARTYTVPVRSEISWGVRLGPVVEWVCAALALASGLAACVSTRRKRAALSA